MREICDLAERLRRFEADLAPGCYSTLTVDVCQVRSILADLCQVAGSAHGYCDRIKQRSRSGSAD